MVGMAKTKQKKAVKKTTAKEHVKETTKASKEVVKPAKETVKPVKEAAKPAPAKEVAKPVVKEVKKEVIQPKKVEKSVEPKAPKKAALSGAHHLALATGRRKSSVAKAFLKRGTGKLVVNEQDYATYFDTEITQNTASFPMKMIQQASHYDAHVQVQGGGLWGQADAVKLAVARALLAADESLKGALRGHGLLTVDARTKERKKYGQKAARRRFQFVKR